MIFEMGYVVELISVKHDLNVHTHKIQIYVIGGENLKYDKLCSKCYAYNWAESFANGNSTVIFNYWVIS